MGYATILVAHADGVATVTLNRPEARNAIDLVMRRELLAALDELEAEAATRVVVLTGAAGRQTAAQGRARVESLNRFVIRLFEFPKPTIAMVDGYAVGAGCNIALGCDVVVASDRARFGEVFARIGLVPDGGGTWLLPRLVGLAKAKELVFSADIIDAAEALRIGLVNRVVPAAELQAATGALAARIAAGPPGALGLAKALLNRSATVDLATSLGFEAYAQAQAVTSEDHAEGVRAFLEKRPPRFTGQ